MGISSYMALGFSPAAFRILSLTLATLIMIHFGMSSFGFTLFGTLCASCSKCLFPSSCLETFQP